MASPLANGHPSTPPSSDQPIPAPPTTATVNAEPEAPLTSLDDDSLSKRPRDARLIHLVLSSLGITSYQERVPLQLLDFAYRYTSGVLSDSLRLASEGYSNQNDSSRRRGGAGGEDGNITVTALRQAIASRTGYSFQGALPKEFMLEQAAERNRIALPKVERGYGVLLPPEKYCLTGVGYGLKDEWESEEEVEGDGDAEVVDRANAAGGKMEVDATVEEDEGEGEDEEGAGRMEDVFGEEDGEDTSMTKD